MNGGRDMKNLLKRTLGLVLVLTLLATMMMPGAFAAKSKPVTNPTKFKTAEFWTYTGLISNLALVDSNGVAVDVNNYKWSSSKKSVVKVSKTGVITAQKPGKATITATNKSNKRDKCKIKVTVQKNKIDNLTTKPSLSRITWGQEIYLKSVEITSPSTVTLEYYLIFKHISAYRTTKFSYVKPEIQYYDENGQRHTIAAGKVKNIKIRTRGGTVKKFKVKLKGKQVKETNVLLSDGKYSVFDALERTGDNFWINWVY